MVSTEMYAETSLRPPKGRAGQVGGGGGGMGTGTYLESQHFGDGGRRIRESSRPGYNVRLFKKEEERKKKVPNEFKF